MFRGRAGRRLGLIFLSFSFPPFGWSPQVTFPFQLHLGNKGRRDPWGGRARNTLRPATILPLRRGGGVQREEGSGGWTGTGRDPNPAPASPHATHTPPSAAQADAHILFKCHISFDPGQRFSMCLAQLLPSQPPPPLTPLCIFSWRTLPSSKHLEGPEGWRRRTFPRRLGPRRPVTQFPLCGFQGEGGEQRGELLSAQVVRTSLKTAQRAKLLSGEVEGGVPWSLKILDPSGVRQRDGIYDFCNVCL